VFVFCYEWDDCGDGVVCLLVGDWYWDCVVGEVLVLCFSLIVGCEEVVVVGV